MKNKYMFMLGETKKEAKDFRRWCRSQVEAEIDSTKRETQVKGDPFHDSSLLHLSQSGVYFGASPSSPDERYVGMSQEADGNILVIGGNGSGKSHKMAMPTLKTWKGALVATDIKGELSNCYKQLYEETPGMRPYVVFDPLQIDGPSYDPFWLLDRDDPMNIVANVWDIVLAIIPPTPEAKEPFWTQSEQSFLAAALLYFYQRGLSFSQTVCQILDNSLQELSIFLSKNGDFNVRMFLGKNRKISPATFSSIERGLRNKLQMFAADPYLSHVFRGVKEGANCFSWKDLEEYNVFLKVPEYRIAQWGGAITLMYTQLIRFLERRPEKHSPEGVNNTPVLLLMDEFPRFGKLEVITNSIATLRSKRVHFCLLIQSIAQLDAIYGSFNRRIICDNCQRRLILSVTDPETQKYLADMVGTAEVSKRSSCEHYDLLKDETGYSTQSSLVREYVIPPHELAVLNDDGVLLNPNGFMRIKKQGLVCTDHNVVALSCRIVDEEVLQDANIPVFQGTSRVIETSNTAFRNEEAVMITLEERCDAARKLIGNITNNGFYLCGGSMEEADNYGSSQLFSQTVGELFTAFFPEFFVLDTGKEDDLQPLVAFLEQIAEDRESVHMFATYAGCTHLFDTFAKLRDRNLQLAT